MGFVASSSVRDFQSSVDLNFFAEFDDAPLEEEPDEETRRTSCPQDKLLRKEAPKGEEDSKPQFGDLEYAFNEHFASGGIFTPRILGTLMGGAYCNRALLEV